MEQNKEYTNRPTQIWSIDFGQRNPDKLMKKVFKINGAGTLDKHRKKLTSLPTSRHTQIINSRGSQYT